MKHDNDTMTADADTQDFAQRMRRIEALVERVEQSPPTPMREATRELVTLLVEMHGSALGDMIAALHETGAGAAEVLDAWARDDRIASVLLLHSLHPWALRRRVEGAMAKVQPLVEAQQGSLELVSVCEDLVRVRLSKSGKGGCGCGHPGGAGGDLPALIEDALRDGAPEVEAIEVEAAAAEPEPALVQLGLPTPALAPKEA